MYIFCSKALTDALNIKKTELQKVSAKIQIDDLYSAYLLGAKNESKLRYEGLKGCTDYKKAVQIIKDGGYATSLTYVEKLCSIIERWKLTHYDVGSSGGAGWISLDYCKSV